MSHSHVNSYPLDNDNTLAVNSANLIPSHSAAKGYIDGSYNAHLLYSDNLEENYMLHSSNITTLWGGSATTATLTYAAGVYAIYRTSGGTSGTIIIPDGLTSGVIHGNFCQATNATTYSAVHVTISSGDMVFRYRTVTSGAVSDTTFNFVYKLISGAPL